MNVTLAYPLITALARQLVSPDIQYSNEKPMRYNP